MSWQIQEAKQRFSELVQRTLDEGPQVVTKHGREVVVVIPAEQFHQLTKPKLNFKEFLQTMPEIPDEYLERIRDFPRDVDL